MSIVSMVSLIITMNFERARPAHKRCRAILAFALLIKETVFDHNFQTWLVPKEFFTYCTYLWVGDTFHIDFRVGTNQVWEII